MYIREVGKKIADSGMGSRFPIVTDSDEIVQWMNMAGLMYADDIVLTGTSGEEIQKLLRVLDGIA